jgi:hypothetical protein
MATPGEKREQSWRPSASLRSALWTRKELSPAFDAGNNDAGLENDQRGAGFHRVGGANADIGAFEFDADVIFRGGFD